MSDRMRDGHLRILAIRPLLHVAALHALPFFDRIDGRHLAREECRWRSCGNVNGEQVLPLLARGGRGDMLSCCALLSFPARGLNAVRNCSTGTNPCLSKFPEAPPPRKSPSQPLRIGS